MSLAPAIPKTAIVLPSNVKVVNSSGTLILQKVKRRVKRFKMSKKQRQRISASARKFKVPILTGIMVAPAVILSAQSAMTRRTLLQQAQRFASQLISYYTGILVDDLGAFTFQPQRLAVGWGPVVAVGAIKVVAKGRLMAINRALSRAQIPANLT